MTFDGSEYLEYPLSSWVYQMDARAGSGLNFNKKMEK